MVFRRFAPSPSPPKTEKRGPEGDHQVATAPRNTRDADGRLKFSAIPTDRLVTYYAPGPVADFDRDGRVDLFLPSWFEPVPNRLFRNTTRDGHWLTVRVVGSGTANTQGIGVIVRAYATGHVGDPAHLLGRADIAVGTGYASGEEALAHLGLGPTTRCDLRIQWLTQTIDRKNLQVDQFVTVPVTR